jgi:hypothetical protein
VQCVHCEGLEVLIDREINNEGVSAEAESIGSPVAKVLA